MWVCTDQCWGAVWLTSCRAIQTWQKCWHDFVWNHGCQTLHDHNAHQAFTVLTTFSNLYHTSRSQHCQTVSLKKNVCFNPFNLKFVQLLMITARTWNITIYDLLMHSREITDIFQNLSFFLVGHCVSDVFETLPDYYLA